MVRILIYFFIFCYFRWSEIVYNLYVDIGENIEYVYPELEQKAHMKYSNWKYIPECCTCSSYSQCMQCTWQSKRQCFCTSFGWWINQGVSLPACVITGDIDVHRQTSRYWQIQCNWIGFVPEARKNGLSRFSLRRPCLTSVFYASIQCFNLI
jgi:hypothetical protein